MSTTENNLANNNDDGRTPKAKEISIVASQQIVCSEYSLIGRNVCFKQNCNIYNICGCSYAKSLLCFFLGENLLYVLS